MDELLIESGLLVNLQDVVLTEAAMKSSSGVMTIQLPVCRLNTPTANKRTYTTEEMNRSLALCNESMTARQLTCAADDHPPGTHVPPIRASHLVTKAWVNGDTLWNEWEVLDTDNGRNLKALIKGRVAIGTSIRGMGQLGEMNRVTNYRYLGTDCVGNPAAGTYALVGSGGVKVEFKESTEPQTEKLQENEENSFQKVLKSHGYENRSGDEYFGWHKGGHSVYVKPDKKHGTVATYHKAKGAPSFPHMDFVSPTALNTHLERMHKESHNTLIETQAIRIPGVGSVKSGSKITWNGRPVRVSAVAGSGDQRQWEIAVRDDMTGENLVISSEKVQNPSTQIILTQESKEEVFMSAKGKKYAQMISEAGQKLQEIRQSGNVQSEMSHIAMFEYKLSQLSDVTGDELKTIQMKWEEEKARPVEPQSPLDRQISTINKQIEALTSLVKTSLVKVEEEEQAARQMLKAKYAFDDRAVTEAWEAWEVHRDDPKSFAEEMKNRLRGSQYESADFSAVYSDMTDALGDYQGTRSPASRQNVVGAKDTSGDGAFTAEAKEIEHLESLIQEFSDNIESGQLIGKPQVVKMMEDLLKECKVSVARSAFREQAAIEIATAALMQAVDSRINLRESVVTYKSLYEAAEVIIHEMKKDALKNDGKIMEDDMTKSRKKVLGKIL